MEPLVQATDLQGFPGAPFSDAVVAAASGAIRTEADWHIAPEVTETLELETHLSRVVLLPTLRVKEVTAVRNADDGKVLTDWRVNKSTGVLLKRVGTWPEFIEVDLTHGYAECPPELLPVIAERAQRGAAGLVRQESLGSRSVTYAAEYDPAASGVLARYTLPKEAS